MAHSENTPFYLQKWQWDHVRYLICNKWKIKEKVLWLIPLKHAAVGFMEQEDKEPAWAVAKVCIRKYYLNKLNLEEHAQKESTHLL